MQIRRFIFEHKKNNPYSGFVIGLRFRHYVYAGWIGYGKPVWWKPRFAGRCGANYGFRFGWLLLCFQIQVFEIEKDSGD